MLSRVFASIEDRELRNYVYRCHDLLGYMHFCLHVRLMIGLVGGSMLGVILIESTGYKNPATYVAAMFVMWLALEYFALRPLNLLIKAKLEVQLKKMNQEDPSRYAEALSFISRVDPLLRNRALYYANQ